MMISLLFFCFFGFCSTRFWLMNQSTYLSQYPMPPVSLLSPLCRSTTYPLTTLISTKYTIAIAMTRELLTTIVCYMPNNRRVQRRISKSFVSMSASRNHVHTHTPYRLSPQTRITILLLCLSLIRYLDTVFCRRCVIHRCICAFWFVRIKHNTTNCLCSMFRLLQSGHGTSHIYGI